MLPLSLLIPSLLIPKAQPEPSKGFGKCYSLGTTPLTPPLSVFTFSFPMKLWKEVIEASISTPLDSVLIHH